jgi:uncharacterized repeat protein (TIGR03803 family)
MLPGLKASSSVLLVCGALVGCGGGSGDTASPTPMAFTVGGSISGLTGTGLVLEDNGTDRVTAAASATSFIFSGRVASGGAYAVTVTTQPVGQTCTVSSGSGMVNANITTAAVTCVTNTFSLGGTVTGLASAANLILVDHTSSNAVTISGSGSGAFSFPQPVPYNGNYDVSVGMQPPAQTCIVTNGSGSAVNAAISNVSVACAAAAETLLHSFAGFPDGGGSSWLVLGSDGNLYGTTATGGGGSSAAGTVFKVTPDGTETVLYSFLGGADGAQPIGPLIEGPDGNFYGVTSFGGQPFLRPGSTGYGTVFKITPAGVETVLYSFQNGPDGGYPSGALVQDSHGNLYGLAGAGGISNNGILFKVTLSGVETSLYTFQGASDGASPGPGLVLGSDGNFYGTTASGGASSCGTNAYYCGTVFKVTPAGVETTLHEFAGGQDGNDSDSQLIQGRDGIFYGTTEGGGSGNWGTVFKITPEGVESVLYAFDKGASGGQPGAQLLQGSDGNFYGTTTVGGAYGFGTLFEITPAGELTTLYSFQGNSTGLTPSDGTYPISLIVGSDGTFYGTTGGGGANGAGTVFKF